MVSFDQSVDFLVVGSGAAGMTAAVRGHDLGGETLVIEKAPFFGGSTSLSGGVVWVPDNPLMARAGISDSTGGSAAVSGNRDGGQLDHGKAPSLRRDGAENDDGPWPNARTFASSAWRATRITTPKKPGGKQGGRSCEPAVFDALQLGDEFDRMRLPHLDGYATWEGVSR